MTNVQIECNSICRELGIQQMLSKWQLITQLYLTLCGPMDCSPPSSSVHEILQARILESVAISYSRGSPWLRDQTQVSSTVAAAKSLQSCPTLCDPIDGSPPGYPIPGILQARTLEWVAIFFSNAGKWKVKVKLLSRVRLFATAWTAAYPAPPPMGFSRQQYWSGVPLLSPLQYCRKGEL